MIFITQLAFSDYSKPINYAFMYIQYALTAAH